MNKAQRGLITETVLDCVNLVLALMPAVVTAQSFLAGQRRRRALWRTYARPVERINLDSGATYYDPEPGAPAPPQADDCPPGIHACKRAFGQPQDHVALSETRD